MEICATGTINKPYDLGLVFSIECAKAVTASLIESFEELNTSDIERNLVVIQSFLSDASQCFEYVAESNSRQKDKGVMTIGSRIREIRKSRGITQKQLGEALGVTQQSVFSWESGIASPACDKLIPLAKALGCDPLWLISGN
ncbi:helix-turn-helix domain-containing protein [Serratia marcescens]|uniref:helix-turn-helix domain-containing protein n=1 Tax=Serratia marcescens TaxID=615 RepID=UPI003D182276